MSAASQRPAVALNWATARASAKLFVIEQSSNVYLIPPAGKPVKLNFPASFLWQRLTHQEPLEPVLCEYASRFDSDELDATSAISSFLFRMCSLGFIVFPDDTRLGTL